MYFLYLMTALVVFETLINNKMSPNRNNNEINIPKVLREFETVIIKIIPPNKADTQPMNERTPVFLHINDNFSDNSFLIAKISPNGQKIMRKKIIQLQFI